MPTSHIAPSSSLRRALLADAAVSAGAGLLQTAGGAVVVSLLGLPQPLVLGSGLFMLAYAAVLVALARAWSLRQLWIAIVVVGNFVWADACVALWASDVVSPTPLGRATIETIPIELPGVQKRGTRLRPTRCRRTGRALRDWLRRPC